MSEGMNCAWNGIERREVELHRFSNCLIVRCDPTNVTLREGICWAPVAFNSADESRRVFSMDWRHASVGNPQTRLVFQIRVQRFVDQHFRAPMRRSRRERTITPSRPVGGQKPGTGDVKYTVSSPVVSRPTPRMSDHYDVIIIGAGAGGGRCCTSSREA